MFAQTIDLWDQQLRVWAGSLGVPGEALLRLVLAAVFGGLIGMERELRGRQAGFRTYLLVCLGSTLAMIVSIEFAVHPWHAQSLNQGVNINVDPARVAYGVMTGIGFIGAGTFVQSKGSVRGLTTAAGLWC
ncbi:MAG: MgtC/SapB family protein, partial [Tepidisphaeraceae bacterium]